MVDDIQHCFVICKSSQRHAQRFFKIFKSNSRRQVRLLTDILRVNCPSYSRFLTRSMTGDISKECLLPIRKDHMPRKDEPWHEMSTLQVIGDGNLSAQVEDVLEEGPTFAIPPRFEVVDRAALVRCIASKAPEQKSAQIINQGLDCLASIRSQVHQCMSFCSAIYALQTNGLRLRVTDK